MTGPLWSPTADRIGKSALRDYLNWLEIHEGRPFPDHDALWAWSVTNLDRFWSSVVDYYEVEFSAPWTQVRTADPMPHVRWFSGARLNWAQHALRRGADDATALVCLQEGNRPAREITRAVLRGSVAAAASWLRSAGVRPGDRIAAYLPNTEHAVIGCLAAAAVGAVWACCSPDFGADGTIGRLAQLEPSVLIAADGYHWNGKVIDRSDVVAELRSKLPTLQRFVHVPYVFDDRPHPPGSTAWDEVLARASRSSSNRSSSPTRCGCCSARAPPGCPRAWSIVRAESPWRARNGPGCTADCVPESACSPIRRPAGRCGTCSWARSPRVRASCCTKEARATLRARSGRSRHALGRTSC